MKYLLIAIFILVAACKSEPPISGALVCMLPDGTKRIHKVEDRKDIRIYKSGSWIANTNIDYSPSTVCWEE